MMSNGVGLNEAQNSNNTNSKAKLTYLELSPIRREIYVFSEIVGESLEIASIAMLREEEE